MLFGHDTEVALAAAVTLVNTQEPPASLESVADLDLFWESQGYSGRRDGDAEELEAVRTLRPGLRRLLTSERDEAVEMVNGILADAGAVPRLVRHDAWDWHVHAIGDDAPLATRIAVETAMAMVDVIRTGEMERLATCAADDCEGVVVDLSRNRSRRYCSTTCGNRAAVAAYRARRAGRG